MPMPRMDLNAAPNGLKLLLALFLLTLAVQAARAIPTPDKRPYVLVVYADWCPSCQQLKPTLALLNERYSGKIRFVRFDITSELTATRSRERAEKLGLADFYEKNHERTSLVIVLDSSRKEVFRTVNDTVPEHYTSVLDSLLERHP
jgi:thiol-disulfide isomerase/thioredoxin